MSEADIGQNDVYRGARVLTALHERHLRSFVAVWKEARAAGIEPPQRDDRVYRSLDTVLGHVLAAARGYMTWACDRLQLPDPGIDEIPEDHELAERVDAYLEHLLARWRLPLSRLPEPMFGAGFISRWGEPFTVESMLEHAVLHPMRHEFQLREWLAAEGG